MTTRRTPTQMAQDALDTATRRVERAMERVSRAEDVLAQAKHALGVAEVALEYAEDHPLLRASVPVEIEYVETEDVTA